VNRGEIRARAFHGLNEDPDAPTFWTDDEMNAVIDEAAEVLAEEAGAIKRTYFLAMQPGTAYYSMRALGPLVMAPYRLWLPSANRRLTAVSVADLDARHETWGSVTGDPWSWFPVSWDTFGLFPHLIEGGGILRVDTLDWPRPLVDDDDEPEFLEGDHDALTAYAVYDGACKRWDAQTMLGAWSQFLKGWSGSGQRSGAARVQARDFQAQATDG
jgi:hypothetical protein